MKKSKHTPLEPIIDGWLKHADKIQKRSDETWEALKNGESPQEDATIYSVYEGASEANAFRACARELSTCISAIHLFTAAPEMLEVLEHTKEMLLASGTISRNSLQDHEKITLKKIEKAITKARGGAK